MILPNDDVEHLLRHQREHGHHQCAHDRAGQHPERDRGIAFEIGKNAPDRFHFGPTGRTIAQTRPMTSVKSEHSLTYTRSPECLCRSLKVSSAIPDLSSSPKPSAIMRSYCSLVALANGRSSPRLRASSKAIPLSFAACAAEKKQLCSRFCMSSPRAQRKRNN